jgi:heme-degrading monooxygenase HmoA
MLHAMIPVLGCQPLFPTEGEKLYARVANIRFPPEMRAELVRVCRGLLPALRAQSGFKGLHVLTDLDAGEGIIITLWETKDAATASEESSSYIGQMSMISSFLHDPLVPKTYVVSANT